MIVLAILTALQRPRSISVRAGVRVAEIDLVSADTRNGVIFNSILLLIPAVHFISSAIFMQGFLVTHTIDFRAPLVAIPFPFNHSLAAFQAD